MIKKIVATLLFFPLFIQISWSQIEKTEQTVVLVRHAEKATDGTKDPDLNGLGKLRAKKLAKVLESFDIKRIYSTDYKRTRQTASPLATALGLELIIYDPRSKNIVKEVQSFNGNVLIVGHSNTTPTVTNAILGEKRFDPLDEKEYSILFIMSRVSGYYGAAISEF